MNRQWCGQKVSQLKAMAFEKDQHFGNSKSCTGNSKQGVAWVETSDVKQEKWGWWRENKGEGRGGRAWVVNVNKGGK